MDVAAILKELESLGTAQNRKVYARHGVAEPLFGVSYAHLGTVEKIIKRDHTLARALWASGNHDARVLATKVADPSVLSGRDADAWVKDLANYVLTDAFAGLIAQSPHAKDRLERWTPREEEWVATTGWILVAHMAGHDAGLQESYFEPLLKSIEARIHEMENRVRYSMNMALICIGLRTPGLRARALAAAERIGPVYVNHGQTGCKTPDAAAYIARAAAHRAAKNGQLAARKAAKKAAASPRKKA